MNISKIHHLAILSSDPVGLAEFYRKLFKLKPLRTQREAGVVRSIWFSFNETILMIERFSSTKPGKAKIAGGGYHLLAFTIKSSEARAWRKKLARHKIKITDESEYSIYFNDPDGNRLALSAYPERLTS